MDKIDFEYTLKYINEIIKDKMNGTTLNTKSKEKLSISNLKEIRGLVFTLAILQDKGITSKSYPNKVISYNNLQNKALEDFGIKLKDEIPFSHPSQLFNNIDLILVIAKLTNEERNEFYTHSELRKRSPSKGKKSDNSTIIKIFKKVTEKGLTIEDLVNDITSEEEQTFKQNDEITENEEQTFKQNDEITENNDEIIIHHTLLNYNKQNIQHLDNILEQTFQ